MHLLIIEDDIDLGRALLAALRPEGFTATWVRCMADALALGEEEVFDAVLLDLTLPDGEGLELLQTWRAGGRTVPVLMITARVELEDRVQGLNAGPMTSLSNPLRWPSWWRACGP